MSGKPVKRLSYLLLLSSGPVKLRVKKRANRGFRSLPTVDASGYRGQHGLRWSRCSGDGLECFKKATRQAWPGALSGMSWQAVVRDDHDAFQQNRILILSLCLSMIFSENRFPLFRIML